VHVQSKYAIDLKEARRVVAEHGWARVITVGAAGLRATYGFFLLEDSEEDEVVVAGHFARADPQCADVRRGCRRC
jgi:predicted FMN-binding regulatory protein PaiB